MRPTPLQTRRQRRSASPESSITGTGPNLQTRQDRIRSYEWPAAPDRKSHRLAIADLDPEVDYAEILRLTALYDLPWEFRTGLILALGRTDLPPHHITADDLLGIIIGGIDAANVESLRMKADPVALKAALIAASMGPEGFAAAHGWRYFTDAEAVASHHFFRDVARALGIEWPTTLNKLEEAADATEPWEDLDVTAAARQAVFTEVLNRAGQLLPRPLRAVTARQSSAISKPAALVLGALDATPAAPLMRALLREATLTRRALVLLRPSRQQPIANQTSLQETRPTPRRH